MKVMQMTDLSSCTKEVMALALKKREAYGMRLLLALCFALAALLMSNPAVAAVAVTPSTWDIIGLDSNSPASGPSSFPVGAKITGGPANGTGTATLVWDSGGSVDGATYIYERPGSNMTVDLKFDSSGNADAYFEVEVKKDPAAYFKTRRYHISSGGVNSVTRELYVEKLVSQGRNAITDMKVGTSLANLVSIPNGGSMNLFKGNTYYIQLIGYTATQGYEQLESFINFNNTLIQIESVNATGSAASPITSPTPYLYGDACQWESDPASPYYQSCTSTGKFGGNITVTYKITVLAVGSGSQQLNSMIHDFSGSSFHYNADYSTTARTMNLIDPSSVTITKGFGPSTTNANGTSTLTFTLTNPNPGPVSGLNFTDTLPTSPSQMQVDATPNASTSGCGTPTFSPAAGATSLSFANGTVGANSSCTIKVNVTASALGTYTNTSGHLMVDAVDTCKADNSNLSSCQAEADLNVSNSGFINGTSVCGQTLATWAISATSTNPPTYTYKAGDVASATTGYNVGTTGGASSIATLGSLYAWGLTGFQKSTVPTNSTAPYFQFSVDSRKYTSLAVKFDDYPKSSWGTSNYVAVWSSADSGTFNSASPATGSLVKNTWTNGLTFSAATTTSTTTMDFRINAYGANPSGAEAGIKNISITGCKIPDPPTITKAFLTNPVAVNGVSVLRFTLTNPNAIQLTDVKFIDDLPAGLQVDTTTGAATTCSGTPTWAPAAGSTTLSFAQTTGATIPANSSCTVSVNIKATTAGPHTNVSGFVSSTESGTNTTATGIATATLTAISPPVIAKVFVSNPILVNGISRLLFTITNPNQSDSLTGVQFTDTLPTSPGAMKVAATPNVSYSGCGAGAFSPALSGNETSLTFTNGTILPGANCQVSVDITAPTQSQIVSTVQSINGNLQLTLNSTYTGATTSGLYAARLNTATNKITPLANGTVTVTNNSAIVTGNSTLFQSELGTGDTIYIGVYKNTSGTVSAATAGSNNTASDTLAVVSAHPAIFLLKQVGLSAAGPWLDYVAVPSTSSSVYYKFTVDNAGDVDLGNVYVKDPPTGATVAGCSWASLAKYATQTCTTGAVPVVSGSPQQNNARAYGTYGTTTVTDDDYAFYATSGLSITKNATETYFTDTGNTLHYSFTVTNSGAAILDGPITVTDTVTSVTPNVAVPVTCPRLTTVGDLDELFDPGESVTCSTTYTVTAADKNAQRVTNVAHASSAASGSIPAITSGNATRTIPAATDLAAIKTNNVGGITASNSFIWTVTVRNSTTGNSAAFASGQQILTDDLPTSGATYSLGSVTKTGVSGTIGCNIASNSLNCTASGGSVTFPGAITGTIGVTNSSAMVNGSGTTFTTQLTVDSVMIIAGVPYSVKSIESDTSLTLAGNYTGATDSGLSVPGSISVPITVTVTSLGTLANPKSGGICKVDPGGVITETNTANNDCADAVTVHAQPALTIVKTAVPTAAKPGEIITYTVKVDNIGGAATVVTLTDRVSSYSALRLKYDNTGSTPFDFNDRTSPNSSGLTLVPGGTISYSSNNGGDFSHPLTDQGDGYDGAVTNWMIVFSDTMNKGDSGFTLKYQMKVK